MGAGNVKAAFALWRRRLPDQAFTVLTYMALISLDKDQPPRYFGGSNQLATAALGRDEATDPAGQLASDKAVKRNVRALTRAGAITLENRPRTGERAVYALNLEPGSAGGQIPGPSTGPAGDTIRAPQGDTMRAPGGGHIVDNEGDTTRAPYEEALQEDAQDLPDEPNSAWSTTVTDARTTCSHRKTSDGDCVQGCDRRAA